MKRKIVIEIETNLRNGEILQYVSKTQTLRSVEVHELLPDLKEAQKTIEIQGKKIAELEQTVANLAKLIKEK